MTSSKLSQVASLDQVVALHATDHPQRTAIEDHAFTLSYRQLNEAVDSLADEIKLLLKGSFSRIGIYMENSAVAYVSILSVLRAGGCYVPISPTSGSDRIATIINDADLSAIIVTQALHPQLGRVLGAIDSSHISVVTVATRDNEPEFALSAAIQSATSQLDSEDRFDLQLAENQKLAYIMYTSGTTGSPNGVMITHANVLSFVRTAVAFLGLQSSDRISSYTRISFDLSIFDVFCSLYAGATVLPLHKSERLFPSEFIERNKITTWLSVPSVLRQMIKTGELTMTERFTSLRKILFCGEELQLAGARAWINAHPEIPIYNLYGPTEATVACTACCLSDQSDLNQLRSSPIGCELGETKISLRGGDLSEVESSCPGEIYISGPQVSPGYWRRKELNKQRFITLDKEIWYKTGDIGVRDNEGRLHWRARIDDQIKVRGYRIEPLDVETVAMQISGLHQCAVIWLEEMDCFALAYTTKDGSGDVGQNLHQHLQKALPDYMQPQRLLQYTSFPLNENGKLDRREIRKMVADSLTAEAR